MDHIWKSKLGICIRYYRTMRKQTDEAYNQEKFYCAENSNLYVCSNKTFSRLEKGYAVQNDSLYLHSIRKLGFQYSRNNHIERYFDHLIKEIYAAMEEGEEQSIIKLVNAGIEKLNFLNDTFYYCEYIWVLNLILQYYEDTMEEFDEQEYEKMKCLYPIFDGYVQDILSNFIYLQAMRMGFEERKHIIEQYNLKESNFLLNKVNLLYYYGALHESLELRYCLELEKEMIEKKYTKRLLDLYPVLGGILMIAYSPKDALKCYQKMEVILNDYEISSRKKRQTYLNLGIAYLRLKDYEKSLMYWELLDGKTKLWHSVLYPCICVCYSMMQLPIPIKYIDQDLTFGEDKSNQLLYKYFQLCQKLSILKRKVYIVKKILPELDSKDIVIYQILEDELKRLSERDQNYHHYGYFIANFSQMYRWT